MYPHTPWEMVVELLGSADHTLEITALDYIVECILTEVFPYFFLSCKANARV